MIGDESERLARAVGRSCSGRRSLIENRCEWVGVQREESVASVSYAGGMMCAVSNA